jgi:hypothetical protein
MSDIKLINEAEFDKNLKAISDAYEKVKDELYACGAPHDLEVFEALSLLRDFAATDLRAQHEVTDNN